MTNYTMPVLSEQERDKLMSRLVKFRFGIQSARDAGMQIEADESDDLIAQIALAALNATPVEHVIYKGHLLHASDLCLSANSEPELYYSAPPVPVIKQEGKKCGKCQGSGWFPDEMGIRRCFMCNDLVQEGEQRD